MRLACVLVLAAAGVLAAGAAAATAPRTNHTAAGTKAAQATLLKAADLGRGWSSTPQTGRVTGVRLSCPGFEPRQNDLVEVGVASTPSLRGGTVGPYFIQKTSVFASATQVNRLWRRAVKPALADCVARDLEALRARGLRVEITSRRKLPFRVAPRAALYRVVAAVASSSQRLTLYFDVILIAHRRAITQIALSQYQTAPSAKVEQAVGKLAARRLGVTPRA